MSLESHFKQARTIQLSFTKRPLFTEVKFIQTIECNNYTCKPTTMYTISYLKNVYSTK